MIAVSAFKINALRISKQGALQKQDLNLQLDDFESSAFTVES